MYGRTSNSGAAPQYIPPYSQYPTGGVAMMNPRSSSTNPNAYRAAYPVGSPYQNGIPSPSNVSGKPSSRPQQVSPKRTNAQPTTPPQQARYQTPYPAYTNGPVAYKPGGSNGYAPGGPPPQPQSPWPPAPTQRDVVTPSLASSTGDSDSNSSNASQQPMTYPPSTMTNGPTASGYPHTQSNSYNAGAANDSTNHNMNAGGHPYMDQQQYGNIPPPNYGYPPQQMRE